VVNEVDEKSNPHESEYQPAEHCKRRDEFSAIIAANRSQHDQAVGKHADEYAEYHLGGSIAREAA
jgi:hypothetical protein